MAPRVQKYIEEYFANKGLSSQGYGFSSGHVWMWELACEESWALKNWCFWTVVLEKTLESPLDCKEIQLVHPQADQSWVFFGRTDAEAVTPILCPPHAKSWLIGKDSDAGKDWRREEKGMTEDEMVGWHHWVNWHEFEWTLGVGDGQGSLACCIHGVAKSQTRLSDWTELNWMPFRFIHIVARSIISIFWWLSHTPLCVWHICLSIDTSHVFYPFLCSWTLIWFPCLGYYE